MAGFFRRAAAVLAGVVLGMVIVAGAGPWRDLFKKPQPVPTAPIQRDPAPDTRV
jgi:hypothetical protein